MIHTAEVPLTISKSKAVIEDSDEDADDPTPAAGSPVADADDGQSEKASPAGSPVESPAAEAADEDEDDD